MSASEERLEALVAELLEVAFASDEEAAIVWTLGHLVDLGVLLHFCFTHDGYPYALRGLLLDDAAEEYGDWPREEIDEADWCLHAFAPVPGKHRDQLRSEA